MNIKCPYCKGVSVAEAMPETGETLQCPYCSRTFPFGQEFSKPTRVEIPIGVSGSRRSAAATNPASFRSTQAVRSGSVKRSNSVRTGDFRTKGETKSGWLNHLAFVFGIGGVIIVSLVVVVIAWLGCGGDGRIDALRNSVAVEALSGQVDADDHVAIVQPTVTNDVAQDGESAKKDVVKLEQPKAVPMPPNNGPADKGGDFSTSDEKDDGDDFASNDADDNKGPFDPDSVDDDEDPFSSADDMASDGKGKSVVFSAENKAQLDGPYFGLRWDQDINKLPDEFFNLNDKGGREFRDGEFRYVVYRPTREHRWFLETMGRDEVGVALDENGSIKSFICIHGREEKEGPDAKEYVARLAKMGEATLKEFRDLIAVFRGSSGWRLDRKISDEMYRFRNDDEASADVSLTVGKGFTSVAVCISKNNHAGGGARIIQSTKRTLESREEIKTEYATMKKDRAVLTGAISQLDMIPDPGRAVYSLSQVLEGQSLANVYDKWSGKRWSEFSEKMLREIGESDRKFQVPTHLPGAAEEKLKSLGSTLDGLKKELSKLGRKSVARQSELKAQIDSTQKEMIGLKRKVDVEMAKEELKIKMAREARKEAFAGMIASIKTQIEEDALKPLKGKLADQEKAYNEVIEDEKRETAEKKRREEEARKIQVEEERKSMEPKYRKQKAWYDSQLKRYGLREDRFQCTARTINGRMFCLMFSDEKGGSLEITCYPDIDHMFYSTAFNEDYALKLIAARLIIYAYENPRGWQHYCSDAEENIKRQGAERKSRQEVATEEKPSYKSYVPKKRKVNSDLKRFKRNDRFAR